MVNEQQRNGPITQHQQHHTRTQRSLEMAVFLLASLLGIYGLGQGLAGLYERGQEINLLWLAVTGIAFFVLFAQMGRVHDTWPRRPKNGALPIPRAQTTQSDSLLDVNAKGK